MQPQRQTPNIPTGAELPKPAENLPVAREVPRTVRAVPGIEGPQVQHAPESAQATPIEKGHTAAPEQKTARVINNQPAPQQQQQPVQAPPILQQVDPATQSQAVFDPASAQGSGPVIADDNDVIEKEWVNKAKEVVNNTRDNPHEQEKQVSRLQADYLKKRYNKDVKVPQD